MKISQPGRWDWPSTALLILMLQVATARLVVTRWTDFLFFVQTLAALGLLLGLALGHSQFKRKSILLLALGYSVMLIPWQLTLAIEDALLSERLASVGGRLFFSLTQFFQREPVEDGLLFVAFISTLIWFLSLASGYWWTRHNNYLAAVLPGGVFILTIHLYDQLFSSRTWIVAIYILLALLLLGRLYYLKNREVWQERRVFQMQESSFDFTRGIVITAIIFVFIAWSFPASAAGWQSARAYWNRITKPWREVQEWFSNAVEVLESPIAWVEGDLFTNQLDLGTGNPLSNSVLFTVKAPELIEAPPRLYWRGYAYASYSNNRWYASSSNADEFSPSDEEILIPDLDERILVRYTITTQIKQSLLYTATQPTWVSRPGEIRSSPTNTDAIDIAAWYVEPAIAPGEQFQTEAALVDPSIQKLQVAGKDYPEWITERYLQLPEDFSPRIRALAEEITANLETPYEKTVAVTAFLRREIEYTNPIPESLPQDTDPIEWVLFDLKKGFCNYYASAEVVMLRSVGIPARMAVGFAEGVYDSESRTYSIRSLDTHAWPEVYFPGIGWVEFEPTGNQNPLIRPDRPEDEPQSEDDTQGLTDSETLDRLRDIEERELFPEEITLPEVAPTPIGYRYIYLAVAAILLALFGFVNSKFAVIDSIPIRLQAAYERNGDSPPAWLTNWAHWATLTPIERSFETVNRSLRLLGEPPARYATPSERAKSLTKKIPNAASAIETLAEQLQTTLFTPNPGHAGRARRASFTIWLYTLQSMVEKIRYGRPIE